MIRQRSGIRLLLQPITLASVLLTLGLTGATLLGVLFPAWWIGDLLSHLRPYYGLGLLFCTAWFLRHTRWLGALVLLLTLLNLSVLLPLYTPNPPHNPGAAHPLQLLHYNLDMTAPDHQAAWSYLRSHPADLLLLQEVTPALADQFAGELPGYRVIAAHPLENTYGSAILLPIDSELEVTAAGEVYLPASSPRPMLYATLTLTGRPFTILSMHVVRPKDADTEAIQEAEYMALAQWATTWRQQANHPLVLIGDGNTTPWSDRFQRFLAASGLRDSSADFGFQPTWPAFAPYGIGLPIDHAAISLEIIVLGRSVGPDLGGDHRPLLITIALADHTPTE